MCTAATYKTKDFYFGVREAQHIAFETIKPGVRIEDTVCVTETGAMSFNHFTKDLIVL